MCSSDLKHLSSWHADDRERTDVILSRCMPVPLIRPNRKRWQGTAVQDAVARAQTSLKTESAMCIPDEPGPHGGVIVHGPPAPYSFVLFVSSVVKTNALELLRASEARHRSRELENETTKASGLPFAGSGQQRMHHVRPRHL